MVRLVIVQGDPATGKTTLARTLSTQLGIGVLAKDDMKELFFDRIGIPVDRDQSRVYGGAVMEAMFVASRKLLEGGVDHIIEGSFHSVLANDDFETLIAGLDVKVVQVYCHASPELRHERYNQRVQDGTRHPGHLAKVKDISFFTDSDNSYGPLAVAPCFDVDTSAFCDDDVLALTRKIMKIMEV